MSDPAKNMRKKEAIALLAMTTHLTGVFCFLRNQELTDTLVERLIELVHRIGAQAERRVEKEFLEDLMRGSGKTVMLFRGAQAINKH